ncbi:hypothetical protein C815_01181 [Firmicutes bacterium M10-2]|nr:hypothetical protein C815_01181 [Firmicutes bacterium M10-2]
MFLKRIELQGFKSFADKTIVQFDHDITGIVGPNGCGKSNINDAIRWVLGEQSVRSLRSGTNMADIIFSGSEQRKKVNMAKVTLVFDNEKHVFDSPFDEIEITRQIHRANNEAGYFINKTPCRLKDIQELIMDTGLGRDSLSIISQGNISSFADAKPEERRGLFEEAAGVAKYKKRKKVSLQKLEQTKENLERLQDIIDELERQIGPLEKQAQKAEKYLAYKKELFEIEISVLVEEVETLHTSIQKIEAEIANSQNEQNEQEILLHQNEANIDSLRQEIYQLDASLQSLQHQYTQAMEESVQLEKRKVELDEKRKYTLQVADLKEKKAALDEMRKEAKFEYENRKARFDALRTQYALQAKKLNQKKEELENHSNQIQKERSALQQLENRLHIVNNMIRQPYQHQFGVKAIIEAKRSLEGIEGTVSELIIPKEDKAMAISNALGASMYQIITKNEASARAAIRFLKTNRSGRATFLPLTVCLNPRIPSPQNKMIAQSVKGAIGWANEWVECDPRYNNVRDRLLANIFITDSLESANECAKRLHYSTKIVTLDGEVVHSGGAMTGGQNKNPSTPMTLHKEQEEIKQKIEKKKNQIDRAILVQHKMARSLDEEQEQLIALQIECAKLENIVSVKKQKYSSLQDEYSQLVVDEEEQEENSYDDSLVASIAQIHQTIDDLSTQMNALRTTRMNKGKDLEQLESGIRQQRREMNVILQEIHQSEMTIAKKRTKLEGALDRLNSDYQMTYEYACTKRKDIDIEAAKEKVRELRNQILHLGNVNLDAPKQYEEIKERFDFLDTQKKDLLEASQQIMDAIEQMDQTMTEQFTEMFSKINTELDTVFKSMFGGGRAKLSMVDPEDVLNTGIDIDVQPPGKLIKNIQSFSGGEKALIAISVLFAILKARLVPLCIFDEVEAALDQGNVERFAKYLSHFRGQSQFLVVTHRPGTMEQCDTLYGVTMQQDGVSQVLKVQLKDAVTYVQEKEE